ncbi:MAG: hypothetical protein FJ387_18645 [Verrucomicrobia bacterium]|nr:hypothetical protein [Verrucomicrobiota bacterium]
MSAEPAAPGPASTPAGPDPAGAAPASPARPSFGRMLRGLWVLTWGSLLAWRRLPWLLGLFLANPLLAWLSIPREGGEAYLDYVGHLYLELLVPLLCLVVGGALIRDEVQDETLGFLVTRPVTRGRLFLGKYLCTLVWLELVVGVNTALVTGVGWVLAVPLAVPVSGWLLGTGALAVLVYSALGALFGLMTHRYVVLGLIYGFLVEIGIGHIPTNINSLSMMRHTHTLFAQAAAVQSQFDWSPAQPGKAALFMILATVLALGAGAVLMTLKEFQPGSESAKG